VALATCKDVQGVNVEDRLLIAALAERDVAAEPAVWDDPSVRWEDYDLVVIRSTWDYAPRRNEFVEWAKRVPHIANSAEVIEWNSDRGYLRHLEAAGVPVIPTIWIDPAQNLDKRAVDTRMPAFGDFVVKPVVSEKAKDLGRYQPISAQSRFKAIAHTMRLLDSGRWVMIQPYVTSIDTAGETCLTYVNGEYQHAVSRHALMGGTHRSTVGLNLYHHDETKATTATPEQIAVAEQAFAAAREAIGIPDRAKCLYARVDLVQGDDGPLVIELGLVEPSLWLRYSGSTPTLSRFADAIAARC
jgi:glutathione synthase/RimK-type ligase-like ATP-grasp enzyme